MLFFGEEWEPEFKFTCLQCGYNQYEPGICQAGVDKCIDENKLKSAQKYYHVEEIKLNPDLILHITNLPQDIKDIELNSKHPEFYKIKIECIVIKLIELGRLYFLYSYGWKNGFPTNNVDNDSRLQWMPSQYEIYIERCEGRLNAYRDEYKEIVSHNIKNWKKSFVEKKIEDCIKEKYSLYHELEKMTPKWENLREEKALPVYYQANQLTSELKKIYPKAHSIKILPRASVILQNYKFEDPIEALVEIPPFKPLDVYLGYSVRNDIEREKYFWTWLNNAILKIEEYGYFYSWDNSGTFEQERVFKPAAYLRKKYTINDLEKLTRKARTSIYNFLNDNERNKEKILHSPKRNTFYIKNGFRSKLKDLI